MSTFECYRPLRICYRDSFQIDEVSEPNICIGNLIEVGRVAQGCSIYDSATVFNWSGISYIVLFQTKINPPSPASYH